MSEEEAAKFKSCYEIVKEHVYPVRQKQKRETRKKFWWQYAEKANNLYKSIKGMNNVIVHPYVSTHLNFEIVPAKYVYASPMVVIVSDRIEHFALLQNNFHYSWITKFCSTLGKGIRYTTSDGLSKFPFPDNIAADKLKALGSKLLDLRSEYKMKYNLGLTAFGNKLVDPKIQDEIEDIRIVMKAIDDSILEMYGWQDIGLEYGVNSGELMTWRPKVQEEILKRLIKLNIERTTEA